MTMPAEESAIKRVLMGVHEAGAIAGVSRLREATAAAIASAIENMVHEETCGIAIGQATAVVTAAATTIHTDLMATADAATVIVSTRVGTATVTDRAIATTAVMAAIHDDTAHPRLRLMARTTVMSVQCLSNKLLPLAAAANFTSFLSRLARSWMHRSSKTALVDAPKGM